MHVKHAHESEAPTSVRVGHVLARGGSFAMRRAATGGREVGEGGGEAHCWLGKPRKEHI